MASSIVIVDTLKNILSHTIKSLTFKIRDELFEKLDVCIEKSKFFHEKIKTLLFLINVRRLLNLFEKKLSKLNRTLLRNIF